MMVVNATRGRCLAEDCRVARGLWARLWGLLGQRGLSPGKGILLQPCQAIHTFLMRFPIDVLFVDSRHRVVHLVEKMPPYRLSPFVGQAHYALELPVGSIGQSGTQVGDQLQLVP